MNSLFRLLQYKIWERDKGPGNLYRWAFIASLAALYAALFPMLADTFGTTARIFPATYLAIAALSWGLRGALLITVLNTLLSIFLHYYHGVKSECLHLPPGQKRLMNHPFSLTGPLF